MSVQQNPEKAPLSVLHDFLKGMATADRFLLTENRAVGFINNEWPKVDWSKLPDFYKSITLEEFVKTEQYFDKKQDICWDKRFVRLATRVIRDIWQGNAAMKVYIPDRDAPLIIAGGNVLALIAPILKGD